MTLMRLITIKYFNRLTALLKRHLNQCCDLRGHYSRAEWRLLVVHRQGAASLAAGCGAVGGAGPRSWDLQIGCGGHVGHITQTQAPPHWLHTKPTCMWRGEREREEGVFIRMYSCTSEVEGSLCTEKKHTDKSLKGQMECLHLCRINSKDIWLSILCKMYRQFSHSLQRSD